jgi:hypothetical protein
MNLVEAVKTGKRFKRKDWTETEWMSADGRFTVDAETLTADDWEVEPTVTITKEQFVKAWFDTIPCIEPYYLGVSECDVLAKELGL